MKPLKNLKLKSLAFLAAAAVVLVGFTGLVSGFPLRFLEPIFTIQMIGGPVSSFPFRVLWLPLFADLVFWFLLATAVWLGSRSGSWLKKPPLLTLGLALIFVGVGAVVVWQYRLHRRLSRANLACGGDWSYTTVCPRGARCSSLGQGPLAGGTCQSWLAPAFALLEGQKKRASRLP